MAAINSLILDEPMSTGWSIVVGLAVVWVTVMLSMIEMKYGKWTGIIGTVVRLLTLFIFLALVVVFLAQNGKPEGTITVAISSRRSWASWPSSACCSSCSSASSSPAGRPRR